MNVGQHIYDLMGCNWNMPAEYGAGVFEQCEADSGEPMGVYGTSTFHQGDGSTPAAHPKPSSSKCSNAHALQTRDAEAVMTVSQESLSFSRENA